jgi:hypothetical protein
MGLVRSFVWRGRRTRTAAPIAATPMRAATRRTAPVERIPRSTVRRGDPLSARLSKSRTDPCLGEAMERSSGGYSRAASDTCPGEAVVRIPRFRSVGWSSGVFPRALGTDLFRRGVLPRVWSLSHLKLPTLGRYQPGLVWRSGGRCRSLRPVRAPGNRHPRSLVRPRSKAASRDRRWTRRSVPRCCWCVCSRPGA